MLSKKALAALVAAIAFFSPLQVQAIPIPGLNLPELVRDADVIAVGQVITIREMGRTNNTDSQSVPGRLKLAVLRVQRTVKGVLSETLIPVGFIVPDKPLGYATISNRQFGIYFLRKAKQNRYAVLSPYYPFLPASIQAPGVEGDDLERVVAELAHVLVRSAAPVESRRRAVDALATAKTPSATAALRASAKDSDVPVRLKSLSALLSLNDISVLPSVQEIVLSPPAGVDDGLLSQLALAIKDGIRDQMAIPALDQLLGARDVRFRRAAASALRHMAVEATIGPLGKALEDSDREVRYNGVLGLAVITKQSEFGPAYDQFERDEGRYLSFWREWLKRR